MPSNICGKVTENNPTYEWSIKEFDSKCKTLGDCILSPQFSMGINDELFWQLQIYPYGEKEKGIGYVSVFLYSKNNFKVKASFDLTIKDVKKKLEYDFKPNPSEGYGYCCFVERNHVLNKLKKYNNVLTVMCEFHNVTIIKNSDYSQIDNSKLKVLNDIKDLYMNKDFYDVTIKAIKKEFQAHKVILSARSKVFAAMFNHEMTEKINNVVEIKDVDPEVLETMLKYIYTGEVENFEKVKELLIAADKYALDDLKNICIIKLEHAMNVDNAIHLLLFANLYNLNEFKISVVDFIVANAKHIIHKPEFNLLKDMPDILMELFSKQTQNQDENC